MQNFSICCSSKFLDLTPNMHFCFFTMQWKHVKQLWKKVLDSSYHVTVFDQSIKFGSQSLIKILQLSLISLNVNIQLQSVNCLPKKPKILKKHSYFIIWHNYRLYDHMVKISGIQTLKRGWIVKIYTKISLPTGCWFFPTSGGKNRRQRQWNQCIWPILLIM